MAVQLSLNRCSNLCFISSNLFSFFVVSWLFFWFLCLIFELFYYLILTCQFTTFDCSQFQYFNIVLLFLSNWIAVRFKHVKFTAVYWQLKSNAVCRPMQFIRREVCQILKPKQKYHKNWKKSWRTAGPVKWNVFSWKKVEWNKPNIKKIEDEIRHPVAPLMKKLTPR